MVVEAVGLAKRKALAFIRINLSGSSSNRSSLKGSVVRVVALDGDTFFQKMIAISFLLPGDGGNHAHG